jgi:hypothetical protein
MESHEVLNETIRDRGAKSIATDMNLSTSLIYKWCESKDGGGTDNPLDRILEICELAGNCRPVEWLCEHTNGFRVDNPDVVEQNRTQVLQSTQAILKEFSELLEAVSKGYSDDNRIDEKEAKKIRKEWEDLKKISESFVAACEKGIYNRGQ